MKNRALSLREQVMLLFLVVLLIGVGYYTMFYQPLQNDLASVATQQSELDTQLQTLMAKMNSMDAMQAELDEIFSRPADTITEIAPYDNAKVVMSQLNGILSASQEYSLSFEDPKIEEDGTVRRKVSLQYTCADYASAKKIAKDLATGQWRCLENSLAFVSSNDTDDIMAGTVSVTATLTFFESTNLT